MGFYLEKKSGAAGAQNCVFVRVNHSHNRYGLTTPEGNPAFLQLDGLKITSIFSRTKGRRDRTEPGDNCPMLYALKGLHNLRTRHSDIRLLRASFLSILASFKEQTVGWDSLFPLPSSSKLTSLFASKVQKQTGMGQCYPTALRKITAEQVLLQLDTMNEIRSQDRANLRQEVKRFIRNYSAHTDFQMKFVKNVKLRRYINPLSWGILPIDTAPPRGILLIDDMVTSGTSLLRAAAVIKERFPLADIQALTLFGSSR